MSCLQAGLVRYLGLQTHLEEFSLKGLAISTTEHRETVLDNWVSLRLAVKAIVGDIRYLFLRTDKVPQLHPRAFVALFGGRLHFYPLV